MNANHTHARSRKKQIAIIALLFVLVALGFLFWRAGPGQPAAQQQGLPPVVVVAATVAEQQVWHTRLAAVGTLEAEHGVEVTTEAAGIVESIHFDSGDHVQRGALLVQLDAEADRARLATLTAQLEQAKSNLARNRQLIERGVIAVADAEKSATAVEVLRSQAAEQRALIDNKRIEAPFSGELGIRQIDLGQFVQPGEPIVSLQQVAPILVNFSLPEGHYGQLERGQPIELAVDAWPERRFTGTVSAINPQVDRQTRNFQVQGRLPNDERLLRPGMFAKLTVTLPEERKVITVPASAISYSPSGDSVFVVRPAQAPKVPANGASGAAANASKAPVHTVARVLVKTGERRGRQIAVLQGIEPGDRVVTAGQLKLFKGAPVVVSADDVLPNARQAASRR